MLTRLRNAGIARHAKVRLPASAIKQRLAELLRAEGYIAACRVVQEGVRAFLEIDLRYSADRRPALTGAKRISRPGLRVYTRAHEIPRVMGGIGMAIVSTPQGVMTGQEAFRRRLGGEVVCFVW